MTRYCVSPSSCDRGNRNDQARRNTARGQRGAATVFADSPSGARASFDIIGAVAARNIPLLFRPLDKLWGAFITVNDEERGIIVTTKLGLPVQRFTLAHELGHLLLGPPNEPRRNDRIRGTKRTGIATARRRRRRTRSPPSCLLRSASCSPPRSVRDGPGTSSVNPATSISSRCASASATRRRAGLWSRPMS